MLNGNVIECSGAEVLETLGRLREEYAATGVYPFLIGNQEERDRLLSSAAQQKSTPSDIVAEAAKIDVAAWFETQEKEAQEDEFDADELSGTWPEELPEQGSIRLHHDVLSGVTCAPDAKAAHPRAIPFSFFLPPSAAFFERP